MAERVLRTYVDTIVVVSVQVVSYVAVCYHVSPVDLPYWPRWAVR